MSNARSLVEIAANSQERLKAAAYLMKNKKVRADAKKKTDAVGDDIFGKGKAPKNEAENTPEQQLVAALHALGATDASYEYPGYVHMPLNYGDVTMNIGTSNGYWTYDLMDPEGAEVSSHYGGKEEFEDLTRGKPPEQVDINELAKKVLAIANEEDEEFLDGDGSHISPEDRARDDLGGSPVDRMVGEGNVDPAPAPGEQPSPMMQVYNKLKASVPDSVLLFRLGDFYEIFGEDAKEAAKILSITLTSRKGTPMAGIPMWSVDEYARKLMAAGKSVAIADPETPEGDSTATFMAKKLAAANAPRKLRILSPGQSTVEAFLGDPASAPAPKKKRRTPEQVKALADYNFAVQQEDRYLGSVFVDPQGTRRHEEKVRAAYERCTALGLDHTSGL